MNFAFAEIDPGYNGFASAGATYVNQQLFHPDLIGFAESLLHWVTFIATQEIDFN